MVINLMQISTEKLRKKRSFLLGIFTVLVTYCTVNETYFQERVKPVEYKTHIFRLVYGTCLLRTCMLYKTGLYFRTKFCNFAFVFVVGTKVIAYVVCNLIPVMYTSYLVAQFFSLIIPMLARTGAGMDSEMVMWMLCEVVVILGMLYLVSRCKNNDAKVLSIVTVQYRAERKVIICNFDDVTP